MKGNYLFLSLAILALLVVACTGHSNKMEESSRIEGKEINEDVTAALYAHYHQNPVTQAQKDENLLISYAIDNNLDVLRRPSGLYYIIERDGTGPNFNRGQKCKAHYSGYFIDGRVFDSSIERGSPLVFTVGAMNSGWNEGLTFMNSGTRAKLLIPSHLGYGERGFPGYVPPNTPIIFDIEILPL
ncbi:MAG: FKBP-type peptidyl-prolyl cis-trans isomerase [Saprospiraceae bacterium]|nr:FKBP-type peptidyl-prolyl cis-trans isomerase [Bacteroidia bacterium]NNK89850.1 FKBP-type peptidyl-prolyl cis-trans isomerase [Saprospiraceae bacterium]